MLKLKKVAITGGVASGKTSACQFFRELGAYVVNADSIVHELLKPDTSLGQQVIQLLGPDVLHHGKIDRKRVAQKVFGDLERLKALEKLLHPAVLCRIEELYRDAIEEGSHTCFIVEIPLLYEIGLESFYDVIITVQTEEHFARQRFAKEGFQSQEYDQRMKRQFPSREKASRADYVLQNNGSLEDLRKQVVRLYTLFQTN